MEAAAGKRRARVIVVVVFVKTRYPQYVGELREAVIKVFDRLLPSLAETLPVIGDAPLAPVKRGEHLLLYRQCRYAKGRGVADLLDHLYHRLDDLMNRFVEVGYASATRWNRFWTRVCTTLSIFPEIRLTVGESEICTEIEPGDSRYLVNAWE